MTNSITISQKIDNCLISRQPVVPVLKFGQHPYADTFIREDQVHLSEPVFPLEVNLCPESGMLQLGYVSNAQERYNLYSYSYTSSNSQTSRNHWKSFADTIASTYQIDGPIVEVGSNDGYLLLQFKEKGYSVLGIDSSNEISNIARAAGIDTVTALFDERVAQNVQSIRGPASLVIANNVFNHANDPLGFAKGVSKLLSDTGIFVFEVPYWLSMVQSGRFTDMVYHEHPSYFTIKSCWYLLQQVGLEIVDYDVVDYHGGSLRVVAKKIKNSSMPSKIADAIQKETQYGLFDPEFYKTLQAKFESKKIEWLSNFYQLLNQDPDAVVIGVGAAAKANTWLTWHGLNGTVIKCITDASTHKQGKFTPLSRIPIVGDNEFAKYSRPYALILSWNIGDSLRNAILSINPNTQFINQ